MALETNYVYTFPDKKVKLVDLTDGSVEWSWTASASTGKAALTGSAVFVNVDFSKVVKLSVGGGPTKEWEYDGVRENVGGVGVFDSGEVVVLDKYSYGQSYLQKLDTNGSFVKEVEFGGDGNEYVQGLTVEENGEIAVATSYDVKYYDSDLNHLRTESDNGMYFDETHGPEGLGGDETNWTVNAPDGTSWEIGYGEILRNGTSVFTYSSPLEITLYDPAAAADEIYAARVDDYDLERWGRYEGQDFGLYGAAVWYRTGISNREPGQVFYDDTHVYSLQRDADSNDHLVKVKRDTGDKVWDDGDDSKWSYNIYIKPESPNQAPTADFTYSKSSGTADFTDQSSDPDGSIQSWSWDFGDGATSTQQSPSHTYSSSGTYTVQLTVTDDAGATGSAGKDVSVTVTVTGSGSLAGSPETLSGSASLPISGSGALTDKKASTSTAATLPISGSGSLTGSKESLTAAATLPIGGSGSLTGGQEETAAAAALPITGEGALNDTGEALSASATLPISGNGSLADREETVAGTATLIIVGSGSLAGRGEGLTGDATLLIVGSGTLADRKEDIDGGNIVTGAGSLTDAEEQLTGDATLPITGGGSLTGRQTRLETAAVLPITGSGTLTGSPETIFGGTFSRLTELNGSLEESLGSDTSLRTTLDFSIDLNK